MQAWQESSKVIHHWWTGLRKRGEEEAHRPDEPDKGVRRLPTGRLHVRKELENFGRAERISSKRFAHKRPHLLLSNNDVERKWDGRKGNSKLVQSQTLLVNYL